MFKPWTLYSAQGWSRKIQRPLLMAIINATPDSFSDGGTAITKNRIVGLLKDGADVFDVGGESTRPGHRPVPVKDEIARIVPVIVTIRSVSVDIPISIDTQKSEVAKAAFDAGADFVNDVSGLSDGAMRSLVAAQNCSAVIMRNKSVVEPIVESTMHQFATMIKVCEASGIQNNRLILDPGLGFGDLKKNDFSCLPGADPVANMKLITAIHEYAHTMPVLIGASRKRFVAELARQKGQEIDTQTAHINSLAIEHGAAIIRTHNIAATRQLVA